MALQLRKLHADTNLFAAFLLSSLIPGKREIYTDFPQHQNQLFSLGVLADTTSTQSLLISLLILYKIYQLLPTQPASNFFTDSDQHQRGKN